MEGFDLNAEDGSVRRKQAVNPLDDTEPSGSTKAVAVRTHKLDEDDITDIWERLKGLWVAELDRQTESRLDQARDADFYDSIQYDEADLQVLRDRNQMPLVFNVIATTIDWVIGTEKRSRTDYKILPRRKEDSKPAQKKTELMKYLEDVNRTQFDVSRAFEDATKVGLGWMEDGWQDDLEGEPLYSRYESWRCMLYDSLATRKDLEDARFIGRKKWLDADIVKAMFKDRRALVDRSVTEPSPLTSMTSLSDEAMDSTEAYNLGITAINGAASPYQRRRVPVYEVWFKAPVETKRLRGSMFHGEQYDESSKGHVDAVNSGEAEVIKKVSMRVHVMIFTEAGVLWYSESPYRHNRYPFTPIWAKRRDRDGMPYGIIRNIRDIQIDINKRASKALHIISTNKVIMEEGAVDDINEFAEEVAKPDAIIVKKTGKQIEINTDRDLSQWHLEMMSRDIGMIQQVGGVTDENLGRTTNAVSGIAIQARQNQGQLATAGIFDNLYFARQVRGEKLLSLIEQFMSAKKQFRITNARGQPDYVTVNDGMPENDVTLTKADFIITDEDWRATMRQAQTDALLEMLGKLAPVAPQIVVAVVDLVVDSMDIPNREEIVKRIRQATGLRDPDAEGMTQEDVAKAQAAQEQQQLQQQLTMAALRKALADAQKVAADAEKSAAQAEETRAKTAKIAMDTQQTAINASQTVAATPAIADISDHLLHEAGFVSQTQKEEALKALAQKIAQAQAAQSAQPQPQQTPPNGMQPPAPQQPQPQTGV